MGITHRFRAVRGGAPVVLLALALTAPLAFASKHRATTADCKPIPAGVKCQPGRGQQTAGGSGSVSHKGWPKITGIRWQVVSNGNKGEKRTGTRWQDELLGRNGSDHLSGGKRADVLWGDASPDVNGTRQHDVLNGNSGNDWIYASHGHNVINAGSGNDHVFATHGRGTINCGSGFDRLEVLRGSAYSFHHCEHVVRKG